MFGTRYEIVSVHRDDKIITAVMPECFNQASIYLKKGGFPPKTSGNDRFALPCERLPKLGLNIN